MQAYTWTKYGGAATMQLQTVPRPAAAGPGEVLIKLKVPHHPATEWSRACGARTVRAFHRTPAVHLSAASFLSIGVFIQPD